MVSFYFQFLAAFILLAGIQKGLSIPPPTGPLFVANDNANHQTIDMNILLSRLDQLEAKVIKVDQLETKVDSLQIEVDHLMKKNSQLEEQNRLVLAATAEKPFIKDDVASRDFLPRSCFELKETNPSAQSGNYSIDPDGQIGGDSPIQVYCDMATETTFVYHDSEVKTEIPGCADPGCYTKAITYAASMRQLLMLADISASCKQSFRFDSFSVPLEFNSTQYGYWNDRNGGKQIFWAGPATSQHTCQCGIENNCVERNVKCNADALAPLDQVDDGIITATELLPITRLSFGRTSVLGVKASYTLGRFECTGQAAISSKPTNCRDLFKMGHTLSGFYDVKSSSTQISSTYCDFSKASTETGFETRYGLVDVKTAPVHFFVTRTSDWSTSGSTLPFQKEYINLGGGMNLASGVFTAPRAGIYSFSFKGTASGYGDVNLKRNGVIVSGGYSNVDATNRIVTFSTDATLKLNVGDQITIYFVYGSIFSTGASFTHFRGLLLEEELVIS